MRKQIAALAAGGLRCALRFQRVLVVGLALAGTALVFGAPADVARGLAWLQLQVQTSGALLSGSSTAATAQAQCETATTLLRLAGNSSQVASLIAAIQPQGSSGVTESLGCWQQLRQQLGQSILGSDIESRRIGQQGYAAYADFGVANALDSGWALGAQLKNLPATDKATLLAWLQASQHANGSFTAAGRADLLATAVVLRGLQEEASKSTVAAGIASKAAAWLLAQRNAQGNWLGDVATTAVVFEAAHPYTGVDAAIASGVEAYLVGLQQPDGSWQGDAYVTAVALRALALTGVQPIDPTLAAAATVRGVVTLASSGQPLAGVVVKAQSASGAGKSATTDSQGAYLLQGIAPGAINLAASSNGYQTLTAQVTLDAGMTAVFSPAMYLAGGTAPTEAHIKGRLLSFGSNVALAGVAVQVTGATQANAQTDAQGAFDIAVSGGAHTVTYTLAGYVTQTQQIILSGGATADVGSIVFKPTRTTSSMRGSVTDLQGQPVPGAIIAIQGGPSATANAAGAYSIPEFTGLQLSVKVSASGYTTRDFSLTLTLPGDVVQDFKLPSLTAAYLNLSDLTLAVPSAGLRKDVTATAIVSNTSAGEAAAVGTAIVVDPQGQRIATLAALDATGQPLSTITLQAGQQQTVYYKWNTGSFAPGSYQFTARLLVPQSATRDEPDGVILASQQRALAITSGANFIGSVTANPPVLRAGTNTPVKLSALIQNDGNVSLPSQDYKLAVIDTKSGVTTLTRTVNGAELPVAQLGNLAFSDWTPLGGGNFRLELTAPSTPGALVTTTLYVGDAGSAAFTVDKSFVPAGDQKVRGTIKVTGQSVANGTINDPLVPLVKAAIVKAVNYADNYAANHYFNDLKCFACHVQTQAVVGGERNLKYLSPANPLQRAVLMQGITQGVANENDTATTQTGPTTDAGPVVYRDSPGSFKITNTTLGLWAASQWHDPAAVNYSRVRMGKFLMKYQSANGSWPVDHASAWWRTSSPLTALNVGSLSALKTTLQSTPIAGKKLVPYSVPGLPAGDMRMTADASGTMYVTMFGGQVWSVPPTGTPSVVVTGLAARSAWPLGDGRLLVGASTGVYIREINGTLTKISSLNVFEAQPWKNGNFLVTLWGGNSLYMMTPTGAITVVVSDGRMAGTMGPTIMPDGTILAYAQSLSSVLRFNANGQLQDFPIPANPFGGLMNSIPYNGGFLLSTQTGLFFYNKDWVAERWNHERVFGSVQLPDGRLLVNYKGSLHEVQNNTPINVATTVADIETTVSKSATWLKAGVGIDNNNNMDVAFRLMGLGSLKQHYQGTARATEFDALMQTLGTTLRSRQRADGGWVWVQGSYSVSDSMITAMVGLALDTLNPSKDSPEVRSAIQLLLNRQKPDGTWASENGVSSVPLISSTWVEIWLPTMLERLGGIDTNLSVDLPATVTLSNPDRTPTSSVTAADGSSSYLWKLVGVTETSQQVNFDLMLKGMQIDEVRPVAQEAKLIFTNSFVSGSVTASIEVPKVAVGTSMTPAVRTDKPVYTEVDQAVFTGTATNAGTVVRDGQVRFSVFDAAGQLVEVLPLGPTISVPGSGTASIAGLWPVSGILSGNYQVRADLYSPAGLLYGSATASFVVSASQVQATSARINADRLSYSTAQSVQLTSRVANNTTNTAMDNLQARTEVRTGAGQSVMVRTEPIDQLAASGFRQYGYSLGAGTLAPSNYGATLQLLAGNGSVLAQSTTSFSVLGADQTGVGITGQLQAVPDILFVGQNSHLTLQVTNNSTMSLSSVPLTVRVVDPVLASVVATFTTTVADWTAGEARSFGFDWSALGEHGQNLVAVASAVVAGKDIPLAQANLKILGILFTGTIAADPREVEAGDQTSLAYGVTNPTPVAGRMTGNVAVQTQAGQTLTTWPLDLAIAGMANFAGNQLYTTGEQLQTLTAVLSQHLGTSTSVLATTTFTIIDRPVPLGVATGLKGQARILVLVSCPPGLGAADEAACVAQRSQAIVTYFSGLGITAKTVTTRDAFAAEMCCGSYNTYWLSGGATKLDAQTVGELEQTVYRGEALWMDGVHDSRNQLLHPAAGVKEIGKLSTSNQVEHSLEPGLYGAGDLPTLGQPTKFELTTGAAQGLFTQVPGQQAPVPAIVSNDHGRGKSLLFAFDLAAMITADVVQANSQLAGFVSTSASYGVSGSPTLTLGDITQLSASTNNQGTRTVSFKAEATLPAALASISTAPQAQLTVNTDGSTLATWNFTLAGGATQELNWLVRATQAGSYSVPLSIYSMPNVGSSLPPKLRVTTTFVVDVKDAASLVQQPLPTANALEPTASSDKSNKTKALSAIANAQSLHAQGSYEQAIVQWLAAADALTGITSVDTTAARQAVALALEASTDALCIQRCGTAACQ
ncbi:carboxypeptidase regulatory-like domain-containing protein [Ramlibacter sp. WS9]|uniref:carboxypeptidase regulatory-like domain-containing protein n=1 Tax=Ramlibacter sp. WS9 TaxID=1882741 RepID=UPI00114158BF|nr:carboxypeptidase regulatory-like domain-containing protein [Ramlibacter sp. WS9]ROZ79731.1 hypothetical protein EEB15_02165 [Ramlibacter sp. WS9]